MRRAVLPCLLAAQLAGCAVGPDFARPVAPEAEGYGLAAQDPAAAGEDQPVLRDRDIPGEWWTLFGSAKLDALVEQALSANPSIDAAQAALRQSHELLSAQWTGFLPQAQGDANASRNKNAVGSLSNPTTAPQSEAYYSFYTAQLSLSYVADVWGATRRGMEAAQAQLDIARLQLAASLVTLSTNLVGSVVQEAALRAQIAATLRLAALQHELTELTRQQRAIGSSSQLDLLAQRAAEAQTLAALPPLQKQLAQTRDALAALLGRLPSQAPTQEFRLDELTLPPDLPVSLPSRLVAQRPDVRAAEEQMHAASAAVGIAIADMLPQLTITADLGSTGLQPGQLLTPSYGFWSLGGSLTQTLFDAGAAVHRRRAADAALDQAGALYRLAVLSAMQTVADVLRALQADARAVESSQAAAEATAESLAIARQQRQLGSVSGIDLITIETTALQAELALSQAKANRLQDCVALFQALGGGWWNRAEMTAEWGDRGRSER